jgi:cytoskeleton protein RodZ
MPDSEDSQATPGTPPPGLGLGERLRSARKARALSVAQVAEALRLEQASVVALEDGQFDAMGAPVFVRGHLKRYALLVGLSPETVLDAYRAAAPDSESPPSLARPREQADALRIGPWVYWLAAGLVLAAVIIATLAGREEPAPADTPPASTALGAPATSPPSPGGTAQTDGPVRAPPAVPTEAPPPSEAGPPP